MKGWREEGLTDIVAALLQRVALFKGCLDVSGGVADAAAGEGACACFDLACGVGFGGQGCGRDRDGADEREQGGDELCR
jgi:hypothetical protein